MSLSKRPFITPIDFFVLKQQLANVLECFRMGDEIRTWDNLELLFYVSPKKVREDCKDDLDKIQKEILTKRSVRNVTPLYSDLTFEQNLRYFLHTKNKEFFKKVWERLEFHGYTEAKLGSEYEMDSMGEAMMRRAERAMETTEPQL